MKLCNSVGVKHCKNKAINILQKTTDRVIAMSSRIAKPRNSISPRKQSVSHHVVSCPSAGILYVVFFWIKSDTNIRVRLKLHKFKTFNYKSELLQGQGRMKFSFL